MHAAGEIRQQDSKNLIKKNSRGDGCMFERFSSNFLFEFEKKFEESGNKDVLTHTLSTYCHGRKLNLEDDT